MSAMFVKISAAVLVLFLGTAGLAVHHGGLLIVDVQEKGQDGKRIYLPLPLLLATLSLNFVPQEKFERMRAELAPWRGLILSAAETLQDCPDGTYVEIEEAEESFLLVKRGNRLVVDVDAPDARVHVEVSIRGLVKVLAKVLDSRAPSSSRPGEKGLDRPPKIVPFTGLLLQPRLVLQGFQERGRGGKIQNFLGKP